MYPNSIYFGLISSPYIIYYLGTWTLRDRVILDRWMSQRGGTLSVECVGFGLGHGVDLKCMTAGSEFFSSLYVRQHATCATARAEVTRAAKIAMTYTQRAPKGYMAR